MFIEYLLCSRQGLDDLHVLFYLILVRNLWVVTSIVPISQRRKLGFKERSDSPRVTQLIIKGRSVAAPLAISQCSLCLLHQHARKALTQQMQPFLLPRTLSSLITISAGPIPSPPSSLCPNTTFLLSWLLFHWNGFQKFPHVLWYTSLNSPVLKCGPDIVTHF